MTDLGRWFREEYSIDSEAVEADFESAGPAGSPPTDPAGSNEPGADHGRR